jgi:hypothetical protein
MGGSRENGGNNPTGSRCFGYHELFRRNQTEGREACNRNLYRETEGEVLKTLEGFIDKLTVATARFMEYRTARCDIKFQKTQADVDGCNAAFSTLIARQQAEICMHQSKLAALRQSDQDFDVIWNTLLKKEVVDQFNAATVNLSREYEARYPDHVSATK